MSQTLVLYAPNVHTGGGYVLLRALLEAWPSALPLTVFLDARARGRLALPASAKVSWVAASVAGRLNGELGLHKAGRAGTRVLCFHGLPPLLPNSAQVLVFQQNRLHLGLNSLSEFTWKTRLRLVFERIASRVFRHRVSQYIVQTPSMQRAVLEWLARQGRGHSPPVRVMPFLDALPERNKPQNETLRWDFVYVADGEAHKNHRMLLAAWQLLAQEGLRPSLALTLGRRDHVLASEVDAATKQADLRVTNLGPMPREDVLALYTDARAVIFPSTSESFGLPLVEAAHLGVPILASELDFVRDVCIPEQTFDPASPVSIARAVKRFLELPEPALRLRTPAEFLSELQQVK